MDATANAAETIDLQLYLQLFYSDCSVIFLSYASHRANA